MKKIKVNRTTKRLVNRIAGAVIPAVALVSFSTPIVSLAAEDAKVYPGTACRALYGNDNQYINFMSGKIMNDSYSRSVRVVCPVVRDNIKNNYGTKSAVVKGYLRNDATSHTNDFRCWLHSRNEFGTSAAYGFGRVTSRGHHRLSINTSLLYTTGYYNVECQLPPRSTISQYHITER